MTGSPRSDKALWPRICEPRCRGAVGCLAANGARAYPRDMDTGYAGARSPAIRAEPWRLLEPAHEWNDLVLAETELEVLRAVAIGLSRHEHTVAQGAATDALSYDTEEPTPGLRLLFAGDAGTGKTMAARALGAELDRPVLRVEIADLLPENRAEAQRLVTQLFIAADEANAIPLLVASRTWLGERPRVMRQHERRIAFEVSGLYEEVEQYPGLIIFASRRAREADELPAEDFDFEIEFSTPGEAGRRRIWRSSLPRDANLSDSELSYLASSFELAGGVINGCCTEAVGHARRAHRPVGLVDIARALQQHYGPVSDRRTQQALLQLSASSAAEPLPGGSARQAASRARPRAGMEGTAARTESRRRPATLAIGAILAAAVLGFVVAQVTGGGQSRAPSQPQSAAALGRPSASYAVALNAVISRLNNARLSAGVALRSARNAQEQSRAAAALAAAHAAAASALQRVKAGDVARSANANLASALGTTADAYRTLARSAARGDARGYLQDEASLTRAAAALNSAFAVLQRLGYSVS